MHSRQLDAEAATAFVWMTVFRRFHLRREVLHIELQVVQR
jgi:hypothetical protein